MMQSSTPAERYHLAKSVINILPSLTGTSSASATFYLSRLHSTPHMIPVYASDISLPKCPQDSVPVCPLRLLPDRTRTCKLLLSFTNALPDVVES